MSALAARQPDLVTTWRTDTPVLIRGLAFKVAGETPRAQAEAFIQQWPTLFGPFPLVFDRVDVSPHRAMVRFHPEHNGLPLIDKAVVITVVGDEIRLVHQSALPQHVEAAQISAEAARDLALTHVLGDQANPTTHTQVKPMIFSAGDLGVEGFMVTVPRLPMSLFKVRVDAVHGRIIGAQEAAQR